MSEDHRVPESSLAHVPNQLAWLERVCAGSDRAAHVPIQCDTRWAPAITADRRLRTPPASSPGWSECLEASTARRAPSPFRSPCQPLRAGR
jgi:hypothetical protein